MRRRTPADALASALQAAGWPAGEVMRFTPSETVDELQTLVDNAGPLAGFGYEIAVLRRYLELTRLRYHWLLVKAGSTEQASAAAELARAGGATLAIHYRSLTVEELI